LLIGRVWDHWTKRGKGGILSEIEHLEAARAAMEAQRPTLGDAVVDAALRPIDEKLAALRSVSAAEQRKLVAVLFADLAGFTALSERLDPEDISEIIDAYFSRWAAEIDRHGGVVEKFIGDAVLAAFGVNAVQEDDTDRAVRAALAMRDTLASLNQELDVSHGVRLVMRVGITAGPVLVSLVGDRGQDVVLVGDTVNLASRLQTMAPENGILISHDALQLVRGRFDVEPVAPLQVKGKAELVIAYEVKQIRRAAFGGIDAAGPMVGRTNELATLHTALENVESSRSPRLIVVAGEAGIGKTRLLVEFDQELATQKPGVTRLTGRATPETATSPYGLLRLLVSDRLGLRDTDPVDIVEAELLRALGRKAAPLRAARLGRLLGFEMDVGGLDAREVYEGGLADLVALLDAIADEGPVVVLIEDLHWADEASLDVIDHLVGLMSKPILLVVSARPALASRRPAWVSGSFVTWIELGPLGSDDAMDLLQALLQDAQLVDKVAPVVTAAAEGNPYYLEELAHMLIDNGVVRIEAGSFQIDQDRLGRLRVPATLTGVLQTRLDTIPGPQREVLDRAAVVGRTFWDRALEYLAETPRKVDSDLEELVERAMVQRRERSQFGGAGEFAFSHALLRDVAYEALLRRRRHSYHALAARWLEEVTTAAGRSDEWSGVIANHLAGAGAASEAAAWYLRAADGAISQYANGDALNFLDLALASVPIDDLEGRWEVVERRERVLDLVGEREVQSRDLALLAELSEAMGDDRRRAEAALRAAVQAEKLGDYERALERADQAQTLARQIGDVEQEIRSLRQVVAVRWRTGDLAGAKQVVDLGLELARQHGMEVWEGRLWRSLGMVEEHLGDYAQAEKHYQGALDAARRRGDRREIGLGLNDVGIAAYYQGDYARARRFEEEALAMRVEMGDKAGEATVLNNLALTAAAVGEFTFTRSLFERTLQLSEEMDDREGVAASFQGLGTMASRLGMIDEARTLIEEAVRRYRDLGDSQGISQCLEELGWIALAADQPAEAVAIADRAMEVATEGEMSPEEANGRRLKGRALAALGRHEEAVEELTRAAAELTTLGNEPFTASATSWLAASLLATGRREKAAASAGDALNRLLLLDGNGVDDPVSAYLACADVFRAIGDPRAEEPLEAARSLLERRAALIQDEDRRRGYLEGVPSHAELARRQK
jgi:class 3 adenylate cyclase/tetratricopeptide (TPR) repeat protein